jgi:hypothetical protein
MDHLAEKMHEVWHEEDCEMIFTKIVDLRKWNLEVTNRKSFSIFLGVHKHNHHHNQNPPLLSVRLILLYK